MPLANDRVAVQYLEASEACSLFCGKSFESRSGTFVTIRTTSYESEPFITCGEGFQTNAAVRRSIVIMAAFGITRSEALLPGKVKNRPPRFMGVNNKTH